MDAANDVAPYALVETTEPRPPTTAFADDWTLLLPTQPSHATSRPHQRLGRFAKALPTADAVPPIPALALRPVRPLPSAAQPSMANEALQHVEAWCAVSAAHAGYDAIRRHSLEVLRDVTVRFIETMGTKLVHETEQCVRTLDGTHSPTAITKACALAAGRVMQQVECPPTKLRAHLVETIQYGCHLRQANDAVRTQLLRDPSSLTAVSEPLYEALSGILEGVHAGTAGFAPVPRARRAMATPHAPQSETSTSPACLRKRQASATTPQPMKKQQTLAPASLLRKQCTAGIATGTNTLAISDLDLTDLGDVFATDQLPLEPSRPSPSHLL
ncbi:hypothetical protein SPRG_06636 [Saprolegnia parasitica CBS 223.65]|uniref:Uncharacterized protein n=1 Tax=Saprolegnia parasitica (strain CBS 223.65) TaxID=695850 RepID=A0A067CD20_SAPPC|nr:hypothetical protein SPRG_06636 [Saprolegnia parasitica CBS 223.65]KDO28398.1 hypothetical protein SPRG_06636 [Saprolegnia parasitica CBS 223.65]|eukprot:XP_012200840.1 hypothetical protein SPRG_06636 [Saprolegnia parasitica CBS 223.65]